MFWIIMTILSAIAIIIGIILYKINNWSASGPISIVSGAFGVFIFGLLLIGQTTTERNILTKYKMLSEYTQDYVYNNEAEKAIIAGKKYDFNEELIDKKTSIKNYSFFWINPEKIKELEYLK